MAFQQREPDAIEAMYDRYARLVYSVAHRVLGRHDLSEEAVQQTFLRAWQAADRLDIDRDPTAWMATIAKRTAIDIFRRESRRPADALADVAAEDPAVVSLPPDLGSIDAAWHVRQAVDTLDPGDATIVRMQHFDGMTQAEVADKLGIALGTVKSRSYRAHRKLAALLGHLREPIE